jgi:predicted acylesterase/phospholipase RssA
MEPVKIQLAIQGGGAKICTLMGAVEAVEALQDEGLLKVTRIAGTSAGSIVGSLFAAKVGMKEAKAYLSGGMGENLVKSFPPPTKFQMAKQMVRGQPFWNVDLLEKQLDSLFRGRGFVNLGDLETDMLVVAANIRDSEPTVYQKNDPIVTSILDSCGIPYYLRVWQKGRHPVIVDGGICENLPSDYLKEYEEKDGPIIAISFVPTKPTAPENFMNFSFAILETAMNNSISRAIRSLGEKRVFKITTDINTFDFRKALDEGLHKDYELVKRDALSFFKDFVRKTNEERKKIEELKRMEKEAVERAKREKPKEIAVDFWAEKNATASHVMTQMGKVYEAQHANSKFKYIKCSLQVKANCLLQTGDPGYDSHDLFSYVVTFQPLNEPLYCISIALDPAKGTNFLRRTTWKAWNNANLEIIPVIEVPVRNPDHPDERELALFFSPPLPADGETYSLRFQDEAKQIMEPLLVKGEDVLNFYPRRAAGDVGCIDLLLHVPERLKNDIWMRKPSEASPGRALTDGEIAQFYETPPGFYTVGWTGVHLEVQDNFGVKIFLRQPSEGAKTD